VVTTGVSFSSFSFETGCDSAIIGPLRMASGTSEARVRQDGVTSVCACADDWRISSKGVLGRP
jgi:hypothetical protein